MKTQGDITIKKVGSDKEIVDVTYKMLAVGNEAKAQEIIKDLDEKFKLENGALTALDNWLE